MIPYKNRFHGYNSLNYVFRFGRSSRSDLFVIKAAVNKSGHDRLAVITSKKVLKSAVGRNRIRRRLYEILRLNYLEATRQNKYHHDIALIVKDSEVRSLDSKDLVNKVKSQLDELGLI